MYNFHQFVLEALYTIQPYAQKTGIKYVSVFVDYNFYYVISSNPTKDIEHMKDDYEHTNWYNLYASYVKEYYNMIVALRGDDKWLLMIAILFGNNYTENTFNYY